MVEIELDRPRKIRFGIAALRDLEAAMGGKPLTAVVQDLSLIGMNALVVALYHGLKQDDPTLNSARLVKILETHLEAGKSLQPIYVAVSKALEETGVFRMTEDVEGKEPAAAAQP